MAAWGGGKSGSASAACQTFTLRAEKEVVAGGRVMGSKRACMCSYIIFYERDMLCKIAPHPENSSLETPSPHLVKVCVCAQWGQG